jgi:hypothetical protein
MQVSSGGRSGNEIIFHEGPRSKRVQGRWEDRKNISNGLDLSAGGDATVENSSTMCFSLQENSHVLDT